MLIFSIRCEYKNAYCRKCGCIRRFYRYELGTSGNWICVACGKDQ